MNIIQTITCSLMVVILASCSEEANKSKVSENKQEQMRKDIEANTNATEQIKDRPKIDGSFRK